MEQHGYVGIAPSMGSATRLAAKQHGSAHRPRGSHPIRKVAGSAEDGGGLNSEGGHGLQFTCQRIFCVKLASSPGALKSEVQHLLFNSKVCP